MKAWIPALSAVGFVALVALAFVLVSGDHEPSFGVVRPSKLSASETPYQGTPLTNPYINKQHAFSLSVPDGFSVGELPEDERGGKAIIFQNDKGEGIQIYITKGQEQTILTEEDIRSGVGDILIEQPEEVHIGNVYKGLAFISDNEAFEGRSREVWFYYKGTLYQISTYERLDPLLKAMFSTWQFK